MPRSMYDPPREISGDLYRAVLDYAIQEGLAEVLLVSRPDVVPGSAPSPLLPHLAPALVGQEETSSWPGTTLCCGQTAAVLHYRLDADVAAILTEVASSVFDWKAPDLPEDIALLRADGSPWLASIQHERDAWFELTDDERDRLLAAIPALAPLNPSPPAPSPIIEATTWKERAQEAFPELYEELSDPEEIDNPYQLWFELLPMVRAAHDDGNPDLLQRIYDYAHWSARHPSEEVWNPVMVAFVEHLFDQPADVETVVAFLERMSFPLDEMPEEVKKLGESECVPEARIREVLSWLADDVVEDAWPLWTFRLKTSEMDIVRRVLRERNRPVPDDAEESA